MRRRGTSFETALRLRLERVELRIGAVLERRPGLSPCACEFVSSGKRLRARCLLASARPAGARAAEDALSGAAAAIELLHAASLVHDDIVDRCTVRRGRATLASVQGSHAAALAGAYLYHLALELSADLPEEAQSLLAATASQVSRGQLAELLRAFDVTLTADERIRVIEEKTASVFGLACELGALQSGGSARLQAALRRFGGAYGVLFQIADDVADLYGTTRELGRPPGADLREGVISLPIALALGAEAGAEMAALFDGSANGQFHGALERCRRLLRVTGALRRTSEIARGYAEAAHQALDRAEPLPGRQWMESLVRATLRGIQDRLSGLDGRQ